MSDFAEQFEDLRIWQESRVLANEIADSMVDCRNFSFRDQIERASTSVMNNIAEGFERRTAKDFGHFLDIAKASAGEVRSMLYLAEDRKLIPAASARALREKSRILSSRIAAFRRRL
ncbi:MAG: four helix bundle protein [Verrucomicrobiota bacterium]